MHHRAATILLFIAATACGDSTGPSSDLVLSRADLALVPGGTFQLEVRHASGDSVPDEVEWSSSDESVALVDADGRVEAVAEGSARITAHAAGGSTAADVEVVLLSFTDVATGHAHACGLTPAGTAWCWGDGSALGDSVGARTRLPVRVAGGLIFTEIDASAFYTCALGVDGRAYCWGAVPLGFGSSCSPSGLCTVTDSTLVPLEVDGDLEFTMLDVGPFTSCGVTPEGTLHCRGRNVGTTEVSSSVTPVPVESDLAFSMVSAGWVHSCALTIDERVYCWGSNNQGELGTDITELDGTPVRATVLGDDRFTAVMASDFETTCAIRTDDTLFCWGRNDRGQLGRGSTAFDDPTPETPRDLGPVIDVSGGLAHVCAVTTEGIGYCWGANQSGQLGDARTSDSNVPVRVLVVSDFVAIDAGLQETTCGVTASNVAYCWGRVLGAEQSSSVGAPQRVPGSGSEARVPM